MSLSPNIIRILLVLTGYAVVVILLDAFFPASPAIAPETHSMIVMVIGALLFQIGMVGVKLAKKLE